VILVLNQDLGKLIFVHEACRAAYSVFSVNARHNFQGISTNEPLILLYSMALNRQTKEQYKYDNPSEFRKAESKRQHSA